MISNAQDSGNNIVYKSDGFTIEGDGSASNYNDPPRNYVNWAFRKAPKFFDIQTWTGNGDPVQEF